MFVVLGKILFALSFFLFALVHKCGALFLWKKLGACAGVQPKAFRLFVRFLRHVDTRLVCRRRRSFSRLVLPDVRVISLLWHMSGFSHVPMATKPGGR